MLANDRPAGASQPAIPLSFGVRSDFAPAVEAARAVLHAQGALLPLLAPVLPLPRGVAGVAPPSDPLPWLGRSIQVVPATALVDADTDPMALARVVGTAAPFEVVARSTSAAAQNWDAIECTSAACATVQTNSAVVAVAPQLALAGFYPIATPVPMPTTLASVSWSTFRNITGLVAGVTTLGDELSLVYSPAEVLASAFAARLSWVWDGGTFVAP